MPTHLNYPIVRCCIFLLFGACFHDAGAQTNPAQPNILLIIADDLGIDPLNGYQNNTLQAQTPTLDSLRAAGLTFTNAWAAPKCTPTRAAILSGKYGAKTGVTGTPGNLDVSQTSLFKELDTRSNGAYAGALIGKWHLSSPVDLDHPAQHGIAHYDGSFKSGVDSYTQWKRVENGMEKDETTYATEYLSDAAGNWIAQQNQPWLMWLAHVSPHSPFHEPPGGTYSINNLVSNKRKFIAMIENLDYEIGRLLDGMAPDALANTIILFIGDNGSPNGVMQYFPSGRGKASLYQGGVQVPLIVSGPGVTRVGETEDAMVYATDLYATILELTGSTLPGGLHNSLSFDHLLSGTTGAKRKYNFAELDNDWTIRNEQYKLIQFAGGVQEFYDLLDDPKEERNLIDQLSTDQQQIKTELETEATDIRNGWSCNDGIQNGTETSIDDCSGVVACSNDNSLSTTNIGCCASPAIPNQYTETVDADVRTIQTNNFPNHDYCFNPNQLPAPIYYTFTIDATPALSNNISSVLSSNNRPDYYYGVALNGVLMAPAPATPFIFENPNTGEYNWDWVFEPTNTQGSAMGLVKLDCASAHTGPQGYHYHGNMFEYAEKLSPGITITDAPPSEPLQIGWASDGFPILYRFGPDEQGNMKQLMPAYRLIDGDRPGDGVTAPCGPYNGRYTNDYVFDSSVGDLDECNGMQRSITLTTANGSETFDYFYVVTNSFPQIARCVRGFRDESFNNSNKGSTTSVSHANGSAFDLLLSPNPVEATTALQFTAPHVGQYQLRIFTLSGNELYQHRETVNSSGVSKRLALDLRTLPAGLYMLELESEGLRATSKLLKL